MTAVSTLIRKVERDPRFPKYLQALLNSDISLETAIRAAAVRIESEDAEDQKWRRYEETQRRNGPAIDRWAFSGFEGRETSTVQLRSITRKGRIFRKQNSVA